MTTHIIEKDDGIKFGSGYLTVDEVHTKEEAYKLMEKYLDHGCMVAMTKPSATLYTIKLFVQGDDIKV